MAADGAWFPLALACAFALATADALTKRWLGDYGAAELVLVRTVLPGLLLAPLLYVWPLPALSWQLAGWMALLMPLEIVAMLLYVQALRDSPLHLTLPYLAFTPVFNIATGALFLGERVPPQGMAGIALVAVGAYLLNLQHARRHPRTWLAPIRAIGRERGSRRMLAVAAVYSVTSVFGKAAMGLATPQSFGPFYFALLGTVTLVVFALAQPRALAALPRRPWAGLAVGAAMALMVVTHFLALARVEVAYMIAVKRTSLLFGILYGALWFGEGGLPRNLAGGGLMVAGVALILI